MQAPRPAALHWSRVEPGQAFTLTLEYDSEIYEGALEREVRLRRNAETGFSESDDLLSLGTYHQVSRWSDFVDIYSPLVY